MSKKYLSAGLLILCSYTASSVENTPRQKLEISDHHHDDNDDHDHHDHDDDHHHDHDDDDHHHHDHDDDDHEHDHHFWD